MKFECNFLKRLFPQNSFPDVIARNNLFQSNWRMPEFATFNIYKDL